MEIDSSDNQPFSGYRPYFSLRQHFLKRVQKNEMNMHLGKKDKTAQSDAYWCPVKLLSA